MDSLKGRIIKRCCLQCHSLQVQSTCITATSTRITVVVWRLGAKETQAFKSVVVMILRASPTVSRFG